MANEATTECNIWSPKVCLTSDDLQHAMDELQSVATVRLPQPPEAPSLPCYDGHGSTAEQLEAVQCCINQMQYNHTGEKWFALRKDRGISGLLSMVRPDLSPAAMRCPLHICRQMQGRKIFDTALPIQCVEAVFIAAYLTQNAPGYPAYGAIHEDTQRITLRFKSSIAHKPQQTHRHIVLAVCTPEGRWGALGISRRSCLQDKPPVHRSLSDLVLEYALAYRDCGHVLRKVYVGLPLPQGPPNHAALQWRAAALRLPADLFPPAEEALGAHSRVAWSHRVQPALDAFQGALPGLVATWQGRGRLTPAQRKAHRMGAARIHDNTSSGLNTNEANVLLVADGGEAEVGSSSDEEGGDDAGALRGAAAAGDFQHLTDSQPSGYKLGKSQIGLHMGGV